jgi:hypothetical protein
MALRTPPSWQQNASHPAENDRLSSQGLWRSTGILSSTDLAVTQNGTPNMSVNVALGWAAIVGTTQANMGTYVAYNDATTNLTITTANGSNPRIDLICMTVSDSFYSGVLNQVAFQVIAGTPAASPVAPTLPANSISLATVLVGTGVTSILTANITDTRVQASAPLVTLSGVENVSNKTISKSILLGVEERTTVAAIAATGTIAYDALTQGVLYYTTNASANFTLNIRGNATTTLNSILAVGDAITVVFLNTNGATPYYPTVYQIDGSAVTPKWQGGTAPTGGNASSVDAYSLTIIKTAATPTYTVFASQTKFV